MSANKELDEIQRKGKVVFAYGYIAITVDGKKEYVTGPYKTLEDAEEDTKHNVGEITLIEVRYII